MTPYDRQAIVNDIRSHAGTAKRVVFVSGNFNIVHPGHLRLLRFASDCGDFLVVGVQDDSSSDVMVTEELRLEGVKSIGLVDYAFIMREPPETFIASLKPDIVVKGKEHETKFNPEKEAVQRYGGHLLFGSGDVLFSSIDLLRKEFLEPNFSSIVKPTDFPKRHGFSIPDLQQVLKKFGSLHVVVIGDLIVDEYINCDPLGLSQEDPTIVVTPIQQDRFLGGAAIVAAHAKGLGASVSYFSVGGSDSVCKFARDRLAKCDVGCEIFEDESRPTTLKQRYRAGGKTLLRVSYLRQHHIDRDMMKKVSEAAKGALEGADLMMFSDFNYGCLPQPLVDDIVDWCGRRGIMMVADSQSSSQVGDVSRFKNMALLTPTEREARLALRDFNSGLVVLAQALQERSLARNIILTLGQEGLLIHASATKSREWHTDRLPAMNSAPKDPAGAGDSFFCCSSMALAVGADIWQSSYLGSLAAACQVGRVGNAPLTAKDIELEISG